MKPFYPFFCVCRSFVPFFHGKCWKEWTKQRMAIIIRIFWNDMHGFKRCYFCQLTFNHLHSLHSFVTWRKLWKSSLPPKICTFFFHFQNKKISVSFSARGKWRKEIKTLYQNWNIELRKGNENNEWKQFPVVVATTIMERKKNNHHAFDHCLCVCILYIYI